MKLNNRILYPLDFVPITGIPMDIRYAGNNNFTGSKLPGYNQPRALLKTQVAKALWSVQNALLSQNLSLYIFDAYRPQQAVDAMIRWVELNDPSMLKNDYVALRSNHSRGIAVDVTLAQKCPVHGITPVDMGTEFDCFSERSHTANPDISYSQKRMRQLLVHEMAKTDFVNYKKEWWHFTYRGITSSGGWYNFSIW